MPRPLNIPVIFGPTASGKSRLAVEIAKKFDGVVINADSMQIYNNLHILTARPTFQDMQNIPHFLYGICDARRPTSAGKWVQLCQQAINQAENDKKMPIICGGTGLYLKALMQGLSPLPDIPDDIRNTIRDKFKNTPSSDLHDLLMKTDKIWANAIKKDDRQRILRGLEVYEYCRKPLSHFQTLPLIPPPPHYRFLPILLNPPRDYLHKKAEARFDEMCKLGAVEEVAHCLQQNLPSSLPIMRAIGVAELASYLKGNSSLTDAITHAKTATRRYIKRQCTWAKNSWQGGLNGDADGNLDNNKSASHPHLHINDKILENAYRQSCDFIAHSINI